MITFDEIVPKLKTVFDNNLPLLTAITPLVINRDLNGKVRFVVNEAVAENIAKKVALQDLLSVVTPQLSPHIWPLEKAVLYEEDIESVYRDSPHFQLEGYADVFVVDRLVAEADWGAIGQVSTKAPRTIFFSIKGGVGRSSALAAAAWSLAQKGKRVLVLDLDLESPGLSTSLLPEHKQPKFGITDWLLEDLLDNGDVVLQDLVASSDLSHDGEIYIVPAHGTEPGEYIAKLSRAWMPKLNQSGQSEPWPKRLNRLIDALENRIKPDVVLIDSRAGIDEVAAGCVTELGAKLILLFAVDGSQTWNGYRILFEHWQRAGVIEKIRGRFQVVSALTPDFDTNAYLERLRDNAYNLFADTQYDDIPPGEVLADSWNFEGSDSTAPHAPWVVHWHRSFAGISSLHGRLQAIDENMLQLIFGSLCDGLINVLVEPGYD